MGDSIGEAVEARRGTQRLCFDDSESILRFAQMDARAWTTDGVKESAAATRKCDEFGSAGSQLQNRFCGVRSHRRSARFDYLSLICPVSISDTGGPQGVGRKDVLTRYRSVMWGLGASTDTYNLLFPLVFGMRGNSA